MWRRARVPRRVRADAFRVLRIPQRDAVPRYPAGEEPVSDRVRRVRNYGAEVWTCPVQSCHLHARDGRGHGGRQLAMVLVAGATRAAAQIALLDITRVATTPFKVVRVCWCGYDLEKG